MDILIPSTEEKRIAQLQPGSFFITRIKQVKQSWIIYVITPPWNLKGKIGYIFEWGSQDKALIPSVKVYQ